jgi:hypothetical protein
MAAPVESVDVPVALLGYGRAVSTPPGLLTDDFAAIRDDPSIVLVAEVTGRVDPSVRRSP